MAPSIVARVVPCDDTVRDVPQNPKTPCGFQIAHVQRQQLVFLASTERRPMTPIRDLSRRGKAAALLAVLGFVALVVVGVVQPVGSASTQSDVRTLAVRQAAGPVKGLFVAAGGGGRARGGGPPRAGG